MPATAPDIVVTPADTAVVIAPLANDSGDGLLLESFTQPAHGLLVAHPDATLTYTPAPGFTGVDSFTYTVRDAAGATATGTVTISVLAPNRPPVANDDEAAAAGTAVEIPVLANDDDPDGDALQLVAIGTPAHGTASFVAPDRIRYRPQPGFSGIDRFGYTISDGNGGVATGNVTVRVAGANRDPVAAGFEVETTDGTPLVLDLLARASDPDGDPLRLVALGVPQHGRITVNPDRTVTYTSQPGWSGTDSFDWTVGDGRGGIATGTVRVRVVRPNLPPVANDDALTTPQDTPLAFDPLANASDPDGDPLRLVGFGLPRHGRLALDADGRLVYTPDPGFAGEDGFTYTIDDGRGGIATGTVRITVTPAEPPADVFANGFRFRRRILLPARQQASEVVEGFVLLVREEGDWLKSTADGGKVESPEGFDLRFELEDGTKLPHEIEHYDPVAGRLVAWVRIPDWDIASRRTLFLYYGSSGPATDEADPTATWQDHLAVWDTRTGRDRTGNGRDLTPSNILEDGLVGPAGRFDGTGDLRLPDASFLGGLAAICVSAVVRADPAIVGTTRPARILQQGSPTASAGQAGLALFHTNPGFFGGAPSTVKFALLTTGGSVQIEGPANVQRATLMVLSASWQSGTLPKLWIDGKAATPSWVGADIAGSGQQNATVTGTTAPVTAQPLSIGLGALNTSRSWIGLIDEVRIRPFVPPASLLALEADNVLAPWRVYALGPEELPTMADFPPVVPDLGVTTQSGRHVDIDVLAAAHDPEGGPLAIAAVGAPSHGTASVVGSLLRYTPVPGFKGEDIFTVAVRDAAGNTDEGTIRVQVTARSPAGDRIPPPLRTVAVSTGSELATALSNARPGDHIVLANGTYTGNYTLSINGTEQNPVVVKAANLLGAKLTGSFTLDGDHNILHGLWFDGPSSGVTLNGRFDRVTRSKFTDSTRAAVILLSTAGSDGRVDHCDITVRPFDGSEPTGTVRRAVTVQLRPAGQHRRARIDHNWFHDFSPKPDPNNYNSGFNTALAITESGIWANYPTDAVVEYNLFENMQQGSGAAVATKGRNTTFRYNTFLNGQTFLELRAGWGSHLIGNWFENWNYVEIDEADHRIIGNKLVNSQGLWLMAGNREPYVADDGHGYAYQVLLAWNDGPVFVGRAYSGFNRPARNNRIEKHTGSITYGNHTGTIVSPTTSEPQVVPVRLTRSDVGPFAP